MEGTKPVNIRPYKHLTIQKTIVEQMVQELLSGGIIRPSVSPFSSPIVLVKKKNNSWRMYTNYRELNKNTVKDRFPIPVIEELLDELHGASIFSKIDLRSGYHEIRMHSVDVCKTAFRS